MRILSDTCFLALRHLTSTPVAKIVPPPGIPPSTAFQPRARRHFWQLWAMLIAVGAIAGCAHYRPGDGAELPFSSLYIAPVVDRSLVPRAATLLSADLRDAILRRASNPALAPDAASSDATLAVTLLDLRRGIAATSPSDTALGTAFQVSLHAEITLLKADGTALISRRAVESSTMVFALGDYAQGEQQAIPALAEALAVRIVNEITQGW